MRSTVLLISILALLTGLPGTARAADDDGPRLRIATFDLGKVDAASRRKIDGMAAIEKRFLGRKKEFEGMQARLRNMMNDLQSSVYRPGSPEHRRLTVQAQNLEREIKAAGLSLTKDIGAAKRKLLLALYADLEAVVSKLAADEGYDLVFQIQKPGRALTAPEMARTLNSMALFHAHPRFDVTERLVKAMNEAYEAEMAKKE